MIRLITFILLVVTSYSCKSNERETLPDVKTIFASAYVQKGALITDPPFKIDWEALAPAQIRDINIQKPSKQAIELLRANVHLDTAQLEFNVSITAEDKNKHVCYLISPQGISELVLNELQGKAVFPLSNGLPATTPQYYGYVAVRHRKPSTVNEGGFVLCGARPELHDTRVPELTADTVKKYFQADDSIKNDIRITDDDFWKVSKAFHFSLPNQPSTFIFFQLAPDTKCKSACCQHRFFIVRANDFKGIAWNLSGCDV